MKKLKVKLIIIVLIALFLQSYTMTHALEDDTSTGDFQFDSDNDAPSFSAWYDSTTLIQPEHNITFEVTVYDIDNSSGELTVYLWYSSDTFGVSNVSQIMAYSSNPNTNTYEFVFEMDGTGKTEGTYYSYYYNVFDGETTVYQPAAYQSGIFFDIQWDNPPSGPSGRQDTGVPDVTTVPAEPVAIDDMNIVISGGTLLLGFILVMGIKIYDKYSKAKN